MSCTGEGKRGKFPRARTQVGPGKLRHMFCFVFHENRLKLYQESGLKYNFQAFEKRKIIFFSGAVPLDPLAVELNPQFELARLLTRPHTRHFAAAIKPRTIILGPAPRLL